MIRSSFFDKNESQITGITVTLDAFFKKKVNLIDFRNRPDFFHLTKGLINDLDKKFDVFNQSLLKIEENSKNVQ